MATRLKETDVVIVGLGAAGGVAALPLAQAGLDVVGLEAGTWLTKRDFAPDELRNNYPRLAAVGAESQSAKSRPIGRTRQRRSRRVSRIHPMMNAVGGTSLHYWAQSWRLNPWDFKVVSETTRRYGASRIPKGSTVEDWPFGYRGARAVLRQGRVRDRRVRRGRQHQRHDRSPRQHLRRAARARVSDAAAARHRLHRSDGGGGAVRSGGIPFPGPAAINSQRYQNRSACMYHGFCNRGGCHVDAKNSTAVTTIPKAQATGRLKVVTRRPRDDDRGR